MAERHHQRRPLTATCASEADCESYCIADIDR